ncbi:MAG: hypothetical protein J7L44_00230 [Candidatus Diapherotrites archaeon]|nr:hypothetical protein [Candidatus Diapherotrites archaeon]
MFMKKTALLFSIVLIATYANAQMLNFSLEPDILRISKLNYGQPIELVARVSGVKLSEARNLSLVMKIAETNQVKYFTKISHDTFVLSTRMPENKRLKKIFLTFELRGNIGGVDVFITKTHSINLTDKLLVTLIEPSSGTAILGSPVKTIKAKVTYINTAPLDKEKLLAKLIVDRKETPVTLLKEGDLYVAELYEPITAEDHNISLLLYGNYSGSDFTKTRPSVIMNVLILLAVVVAAIFALRWFVSYMQKEAERRAQKKAEEAEEEPEEELEPEEGAVRLEEVKLTAPEPEAPPVAKTEEEKPHIEEFIVEKPRKVEEIPMEEPKREEPIVGAERKAKYEIVAPEEKPTYRLPEEQPAEQPEEKKEEKEERKKKTGLLPFMVPEKKKE